MAVAVPFIASAMGATAMQATLISVAFTVTGINDKINKAATKVFGEDLVKIGNIAGAAYAMTTGGFSLDPAKEALGIADAAAGASSAASTATAASNAASVGDIAFEADWLAATEGAGGLMTGEALAAAPTQFNLAEMVEASTAPGAGTANGIDPATGAKYSTMQTDKLDIIKNAPGNADNSVVAQSTAQAQGAAAPTATAADATASVATTPQAGSTSATGANATAPQVTKAPESFFDRLVYDKDGRVSQKLVGTTLTGLGAGYAAAQKAKEEQAKLDELRRRRTTAPSYKLV